MEVTLDAEWTKDGRLVFTSPIWREMDLQVCVHGEKLRWTCDECAKVVERALEKEVNGK